MVVPKDVQQDICVAFFDNPGETFGRKFEKILLNFSFFSCLLVWQNFLGLFIETPSNSQRSFGGKSKIVPLKALQNTEYKNTN